MEFETIYQNEIVCPFCGYEFTESNEINPGNEDVGEIDCPICEKIMYVTRNIDISYSTEKVV